MAATRAVDAVEFSGLTWFNQAIGTMFADVFDVDLANVSGSRIISGVGFNSLIQRSSNTGVQSFNNGGSGTIGATLGSGGYDSGAKLALSWDAGSRKIVGNDGSVSAPDANTIDALTEMHVMSRSGTGNFTSGFMRQLTFYPTLFSDADLKALTVL